MWQGMWQALTALIGAAVTVAACYAAGALFVDRLRAPLNRAERLPLAFVLGAACLHLAIFAVMALKIAYRPVVVGVPLAVIGVAVWTGSWGLKGDRLEPVVRPLKILAGVLFAAFTILYFFHAWAPESSPDGSTYHLGLVAQYLRVHGFEPVTTNFLASLSEGVEMLFVPAFAIGQHSAAALVHLAFAVALALAMFAYGRRLGSPPQNQWMAAAAALLTYASPVVGIDASSAYNDVAAAAVVFSAFYWLEVWDEHHDHRLLIPLGLLCGYAYAVKYTAAAILLYAVAFVAWRIWRLKLRGQSRRMAAACAVIIAGFAVMAAPWMIKNWVYVDNPVAPLANRIFRNPYMHVSVEQQLSEYARSYDVRNRWTLPLEVTLRGEKTQGVIGAMFLAAPLALLALRDRAGRRLLAAGAVMLAPYFANVGTRFLIPVLPFLSLAMAIPLASSTALLAALMIVHSALSWPSVLHRVSPHAWSLDRVLYKQALRILPQDFYLRQNYPPYGAARLLDQYVPKGEQVLAMTDVPEAYTSRDVLVSFRAAFNQTLADTVNMGWYTVTQPRVVETFGFPEQNVRGLRVVQTARGSGPLDQWSVHELRFFDRGAEVARKPQWRLSAWPNPWDAGLAFDRSPVTRWRSWETKAPGMYLEADFGEVQSIDEVRIETSYDSGSARMHLESTSDDGRGWVKIAGDPEIKNVDPPPDLRRQAIQVMRSRGVDYLLMHDTDPGAEEFRRDPASWGLELVAQGYGVRLYKVAP
jgi:F5/8 type C domain